MYYSELEERIIVATWHKSLNEAPYLSSNISNHISVPEYIHIRISQKEVDKLIIIIWLRTKLGLLISFKIKY